MRLVSHIGAETHAYSLSAGSTVRQSQPRTLTAGRIWDICSGWNNPLGQGSLRVYQTSMFAAVSSLKSISLRYDAQNETELAAELVGFFQQFLKVFAELKEKKFYLTGESVRSVCSDISLFTNFIFSTLGCICHVGFPIRRVNPIHTPCSQILHSICFRTQLSLTGKSMEFGFHLVCLSKILFIALSR